LLVVVVEALLLQDNLEVVELEVLEQHLQYLFVVAHLIH